MYAMSTLPVMATMVGPPPPPMGHHTVKELRMLKILDRQSGICLFTEQWKWHPHAHAEGVDALVQSFTQFAREIDGGEVTQVHFNPTMGKNDPKIADDRRPNSGPMQFTVVSVLCIAYCRLHMHDLLLICGCPDDTEHGWRDHDDLDPDGGGASRALPRSNVDGTRCGRVQGVSAETGGAL
ncbi:hypothetical protein FI667_g1601, partial [Globisporangium splendens]